MTFREEFTMAPDLIYLNSGTHSICPSSVLDAITRHQREYELNPTIGLFNAWGHLWKVQTQLAEFFRADPRDLFLRPNVTEAMNAFVLGMPLRPKSEILVTDLEYGAITNLARFRAERDGLSLRTLRLPGAPADLAKLTASDALEAVLSQLTPATSMLVMSDVMTGNGLVLPLEKIARETRRRGILLVVDGAHGPGFLPLDFSRLDDVDFYGGNLHKWMLGPKGTGFGWVPKRHQTALPPLQAGWTSFETPPIFQAFGGGSRFASAQMMPGCRDFAPFFALEELFAFWKRHGRERIVSRVRELQLALESRLDAKLGWAKASPPVELRGPLLAYEVPARLCAQAPLLLGRLLTEQRLMVVFLQIQGRWQLRVSPHVYNTEDELDRATEILAEL